MAAPIPRRPGRDEPLSTVTSTETLRVEAFAGASREWDGFVTATTGWTHCHLYGWKQLIESLFGHDCPYLACRTAEGGICGVLPLVRVRSWLFGHYLVSMPFLNYGGPLGSDVAVRALGQEAARRAKLEGVRLLELRSRVELPLDLRVSHRKLTVLVDIPGSSAALWAGFSTKIRNKVRRAQKAGVSVRFGPEEMGPFFSVFARHMRDLGTPTQSERFFQGIQDAFPDSVVFGCAYHGGRVIAGGCGFRWGDEFEITWSSALREHTDVRANYLLQWAFMERAANEGCRTFNFGRSSPGGGTHEFKRQWGGRDEPLWWYQFPPEAESTPSPDQGAYRWGPRLWRLLPVGLATRLGPGIVRYIP